MISLSALAAAALSMVRTLVVPTAMTRPPRCFVWLIKAALSALTSHHSVWILCSSGEVSVTGAKVSRPTCSVTRVKFTPYAAILSMSQGVKCSPAVGAAAEPLSAA